MLVKGTGLSAPRAVVASTTIGGRINHDLYQSPLMLFRHAAGCQAMDTHLWTASCGRLRDDGHRGTFDGNLPRRVERDLARQSPTDSYDRSDGRRKVRCTCRGLAWWRSVRGPHPRVDAERGREPRARQRSALGVRGRMGCRDRPNSAEQRRTRRDRPNSAGRAGSSAAARTTGMAWIRSPSQFGSLTRSGRATGPSPRGPRPARGRRHPGWRAPGPGPPRYASR